MRCNIDYYPLTQPQKGIWYTEKLYPGTSIGTIAATLKLQGDIDYLLLEKAVNLLVEKNDAIRLRFTQKDNEPYQYVSNYKYKKLQFFDFSQSSSEELFAWDKARSEEPFDLIDSDLFHFDLIKISDNVGGFFVKMHHLISDAWSMSIVGNNIVEYYSKLKNGELIDPSKKPSYLDFILRENDYFESGRFKSDNDFWTKRLSAFKEVTTLKPRTSLSLDSKARRKTHVLPKKLTDKLRKYCSENKVSEYALFFAALSMYINRVSGKEDLTIGTTLLNRTNAKEKATFGMFVSTAVPVRVDIHDDWNLKTFAESISREILSVLRHQKYPYNLLLKQIREQSNADNIFDIVLTYQNSKFMNDSYEPFTTRWHFSGHQIESLIINVNDRDNDDKFIIDYDYLLSMFNPTEIDFIHHHILSILWHGLDNPYKPISKLEMISELEKHKLLKDFNDTACDYPRDKTIQQLFEEQVKRTPNKRAAVFEGKSITYDELNRKANQVARMLRDKGLTADEAVSIMVQRSLEMIIGIMGILKAGGAYLPIDPKYPLERKEYILQNSKSKLLLTLSEHAKEMKFGGTVINLDDCLQSKYGDTNLENINKPTDLAYIIYTSGSTGNPKGVMIEHHSLINRLNWMQKKYPLDDKDVILQKTTYTFDVSVWELIWGFIVGAETCFLIPDGEKDPEEIIKAIEKNVVTTLHFVPSMLNMFLDYIDETKDTHRLSSLKQVFASGEALTVQQVEKFNRLLNKNNGTLLSNLYGPTEASIDVTYYDCRPEKKPLKTVPIGKPIDNTKIFILDKNMNLLPIGIAGELYIGGVGVARGYINNEELTREKFVDNPFNPGGIIYRTGDLARWYPKGDIEYLGRIDSQIKIRGFRIELGEIEKRLLEHKDVNEVVVVGKARASGENYLCAYYVSQKQISYEALKAFLLSRLPDYMVPSFFVQLNSLPLLSNGKINRKALPEPDMSQKATTSYEAPSNEVERVLLEICQECLKRSDFGVNDNLFDLGADSLAIIDMLIRAHKHNWGITAADFYNCQTVKLMSDKILADAFEEVAASSNKDIFDLKELGLENKNKKAGKLNNVLLTGVTGFLGIHILRELIDNSNATVYCLIRGKDQSNAVNKLKGTLEDYFAFDYARFINKRIFVIEGDIGQDKFSLEDKDYLKLSETIDTVIHSAAIVKYYGDYAEFANTNVAGTQRIAQFVREYEKKLYYISTLAIAGSYLTAFEGEARDFNEDDFFVGQNYKENVYVRSKFEAEKVIFNEVKQGMDATIFRMGNLTGRFSDGYFQKNIHENAFYSIIRSIILLKAIPENQLDVDVEFSPVDLAAKAILLLMQEPGRNELVYHITNNNEVTIGELINMFSRLSLRIKVLKTDDFSKLVERISEDRTKHDILAGIIADMSKDNALEYGSPISINSNMTKNNLARVGFEWPMITLDYIKKLIEHMQVTGFIRDSFN
ncbi:MAG: amino acid adenylation domain-containing protein [Clostridiaceae bacterium]|jgi:amino acid adenylation domain-containing protein/thioester reductase-like protein|nr:amino acid adenylation domain-containing protein [Clostridiaceae bacterium]